MEKSNKNISEMTYTNKARDINVSGNGENKNAEKLTLIDKIRKIKDFFTVEPFLLCYILPMMILSITVQKFNTEKACRSDLSYSQEICDHIQEGDFTNNDTISILEEASKVAIDVTTWKEPLTKFVPAILMLNIGAWSDRTGNRKALMMVPIFGDFLASLGYLLATYYFVEWPLWITGLIEALCSTFTGGLVIAISGAYSYVADVTSPETRTFRIGIVAVIVTLGIPAGTSIGGILTESIGYYGTFGIGSTLYFLGFIYAYFKIHDVSRVKEEGSCGTKFMNFLHPRNFWETFSLLALSRGRRLAQILLVICAHIIINGPVIGESSVLYFYTLIRYKMEIVEFSLFNTYTILLGTAGTAIAVGIFSKALKLHDTILGMIATTSKVLGTFVYAFAPDRTWLYVAAVLDMFGNSGVTAIRSLGTKVVDPDSVGKICSLIGFVDAIIPIVAVPIYSQLWNSTLDWFPGAIYVLGGVLTMPDFLIFIALYVIHKKQESDTVKNANSKEMYAYENDVTAL
ncbi:proton-coupled folate transporter-like [Plodia interpunctella]|uniref:proton-coupled folate transporter-like n=1 Tax=Plodia interpunctella TaxID=58824 RepID=UPI002367E0F2|nr:proton-coupled folate transporter-like [Plodia interpunctella]